MLSYTIDDFNFKIMAKSKTGNVSPKGKPTGNENDTHHVKETFAGAHPKVENEIADKYTKDGADKIVDGVHVRHVNRNTQ